MPVFLKTNSPGLGDHGLVIALLLLAALLAGCNGGKNAHAREVREATTAGNDTGTADARPANARTSPASTRKLSWQPPLTREDGSSLYPGEILGYRIYFKKNHHNHFRTIPVNDPSDTSLALDQFSPGVYLFSISTIDINGLESRRSVTVRVNIT